MRFNNQLKILCGAVLVFVPCHAFSAEEPSQPEKPVAPLPFVLPPGVVIPGFPGSVSLAVPPVPHEKNPNTWPQPDYFSEALQTSDLKPDERFRSLKIRAERPLRQNQYVALPVQTQAFGFAPGFRALVGASLEWLLSRTEGGTTRLTEVLDANGPFVRRFDEAAVQSLIKDHPEQKFVLLYLGQDGIDHTFLTLIVRDGKAALQSHQTIDLPKDPLAALDLIVKALPVLIKGAGITVANKEPVPDAGNTCKEGAWNFADPAPASEGLQGACRALALGTLLPAYETPSQYSGGLSSPAKLAWLSSAYVQATRGTHPSDTARAIGILALNQIALGTPDDIAAVFVSSPDPVVSRVAKLLSKKVQTSTLPVRSANEAFGDLIRATVKDLPAFTQALFLARVSFGEAFRQVDFCSVENQYPGMASRSQCPPSKAAEKKVPARPVTNVEFLLYQDWRIASLYKDISHYGKTLALPDRVREVVSDLPSDVAAHPFIQQLVFATGASAKFMGNSEELLIHSRGMASPFVQSTANLQDYTNLLAGYSLSEHTWVANLNLKSDTQIQKMEEAEQRFLYVLKLDRFYFPDRGNQTRVLGEPAFFLSPSVLGAQRQWQMAQRRPMARPPMPGTSVPQQFIPPQLGLFPLDLAIFGPPSVEILLKRIANRPRDMDARSRLAIRRLKEGTPIEEAIKLIDEYPKNETIDNRVGESHAWALAAHAFYFSGEIDAAKRYYQRSESMGTGSDSEMQAEVRLSLIDGQLRNSLKLMESRLGRYDTDYARRDLAGLLFMTKQTDKAWQVFLPRAASAENFQLWVAAFVGHRMSGMNLRQISDWLTAQKLDDAHIEAHDVAGLYLHLYAVTDRVPTDADIEILRTPRGKSTHRDTTLAVSAQLMRSAMENKDAKQAYDYAIKSLLPFGMLDHYRFMFPFYAWAAWQATDGKDENLEPILKIDLQQGFDHVLAKSMTLALEGKPRESLQYFRAARYELSALARGELSNRAIPAPYQYALAGYLMFQKTGNAAYRDETLRFLRSYQKVFPFYGWVYSLEAVMEQDQARKIKAACRTQFLDPQSFFLKIAKSNLKREIACKDLFE